ncbi:MAG: hypothetical protein LBU32_09865 [Clostridiales bacterium]|jgi:hypothetical protein|nr:hypothetical protein [Clostridiales bacterium]
MKVKLVKYILMKMTLISAIYLAGFTGVITLLTIVFRIFGVLSEGKAFSFISVVPASNSIFMLIIGFVMPLMMLRHFVELGVTRKQYSLSLGCAGVGVALCFTLVAAIAALSSSGINMPALAAVFARHIAAFAIGGLAASGYLLKRVISAIASSLLFCVLTFDLQSYISIENDLVWSLLYIAVFALCTFLAAKVAHYAPIKA